MLTAFNKNEDTEEVSYGMKLIELYSQRNRFYHNLSHIGNLFHLFEQQVAVAGIRALIWLCNFLPRCCLRYVEKRQ